MTVSPTPWPNVVSVAFPSGEGIYVSKQDIPQLIRDLRSFYLTTDDLEDAKEHADDDVTDLLTETDFDVKRR